MSLTLHFHPLSSFSQKVLTALYEKGTPFRPEIVDLMSESGLAAYRKIWPIGKIPVLRDEARGRTIPETSIIIEYLDLHHPGAIRLVPEDAERAQEVRLRDRFFDLYVNVPMQKIVTDALRPEGKSDPFGVAEAKALLRTACDMVEADMAERRWATGEDFTMADCAAAPALFYADQVMPLGAAHPNTARYLGRLMARPSFARALAEAKPYWDLFPGKAETA